MSDYKGNIDRQMRLHPLIKSGYSAPLCSIFILDTEADICTGTNTPGAGYKPGIDLGDLDDEE